LDTSESVIKFLRGGRTTFNLVDSFVENLGNIKETNDVSVFVAYGLKGRE
jgi:hypothetical protein